MRERIHGTAISRFCCRLALVILCATPSLTFARMVDFEDIELEPETDLRVVNDEDGNVLTRGFIDSGGVQFVNETQPWGWSLGFLVSNRTDTQTPGFDPSVGDFGAVVNDSSSFAGGGANGSANYGVSFGYLDALDPLNISQLELLPHLVLPSDQQIVAADFTNTTWAGLSMSHGDGFAKAFGGESGSDPDFLRLSVYGSKAGTPLSDQVEMYLADFRSENADEDFILREWQRLDLTPLAEADRLYFNLDSSDVGDFGMNTPSFFAIDNIELQGIEALLGDYSGNGSIDNEDVDRLCSEVTLGADASLEFDFNGDGAVDPIDVNALLSAAGVLPSDVNFDGTVDFADFLILSNAFGKSSVWSRGDFDCDGVTQFSDFLTLSAHFGQSSSDAQSVPEPSSSILSLAATFGLSLLARRRIGRN